VSLLLALAAVVLTACTSATTPPAVPTDSSDTPDLTPHENPQRLGWVCPPNQRQWLMFDSAGFKDLHELFDSMLRPYDALDPSVVRIADSQAGRQYAVITKNGSVARFVVSGSPRRWNIDSVTRCPA